MKKKKAGYLGIKPCHEHCDNNTQAVPWILDYKIEGVMKK
jgi:hypothetical protein